MGDFERMHFVPKTYMKRFGFSERGTDKIHMVPKKEFFGPIKTVGLSNICVENEIYSMARPGEINDPAIEHLFTNIFDKEYSTIYDALVHDKLTSVTYTDLYSIIAWITSMFLRNQQTNNFILQNFENHFVEKYHQAVDNGDESFTYRRHTIPINGKSLPELKAAVIPWNKPYVNGLLFQGIAETAELRAANSIVSMLTLTTEAEFITSDNPVTTQWSRDDSGVQNGGHVRCIPLDSKHLLSIRPNHQQLNPFLIYKIEVLPEYEKSYVFERNQIQLKLSRLFTLGSSTALAVFLEQMRTIL
ncbi:MAG TPA: DUF4238 domain-containing protein [Puia sp.]|jgi:hypothetical protein